jgi:hypothetical protein
VAVVIALILMVVVGLLKVVVVLVAVVVIVVFVFVSPFAKLSSTLAQHATYPLSTCSALLPPFLPSPRPPPSPPPPISESALGGIVVNPQGKKGKTQSTSLAYITFIALEQSIAEHKIRNFV